MKLTTVNKILFSVLFCMLAMLAFCPPAQAQVNNQRAQTQIRFVTALPATCRPNQGIIWGVIGSTPFHYWMCWNTNVFVDITDSGSTPALTSTRVAFGSAVNLITESADFTFNNTTKSLLVNSGSAAAFINANGLTTASAFRMNAATSPGAAGGLIMPFVGGGVDTGPGITWTGRTSADGIYTDTSSIFLSLGFNTQGASGTHDPFKIRKGTGTSAQGALIYELRPTDGYFQMYPFGTGVGNTTALRFTELAAGGFNYVALKAPDAITGDITYTLPATLPASAGCLEVNSAGVITQTGSACGGAGASGANPTAVVGLAAVNGVAATFLRSDGAPALDQGIAPTWTGIHTWGSGLARMTSPRITTSIFDANGLNWLAQTATASAVNYLTLSNTATGASPANNPTITATGTDANIGITLANKGSGVIQFQFSGVNDFYSINNSGTFTAQTNSGGIKLQYVAATPNLRLSSDNAIVFNSTTNLSGGALDTFFRRAAAANLAQGTADVDTAPVAQIQSVQNTLAGGTSNVAGANWTRNGSQGKGTGVGGALVWQVAPAGTTGTVVNPLVEAMRITGAGVIQYPTTITAGGTTGNQTINKVSGTVNIAAAGTTVTVTNSLVSANSICFGVIRTNDSTAALKNVVPGAGSFVITLSSAATAETSVGFFCINP